MNTTPERRILVVEDEPAIRQLVQRVLQKEGLAVKLGANPREGEDAIAGEEFALLLTDLRLPDGSGTETIRRFKTRFPQAPVLIMTGSLTPEERLAQVNDLGVLQCLHKPFELVSLQQAVARALEA